MKQITNVETVSGMGYTKSEGIKLPIVKNKLDGKIIHISEKIPHGTKGNLICPICGEHVHYKAKTSTKRAYFSHNPKGTCNTSYETLLHELSKIYIHYCLVSKQEFKIKVCVEKIKNSKIKCIYKSLGLIDFTITSKQLLLPDVVTHKIESKLDKYTPDLTSLDKNGKPTIAWEVFVSHSLEDRKEEFLNKFSIRFFELIPDNFFETQQFSLNKYDNFEIFTVGSNVYDKIYELKQEEILLKYKNEVEKKHIEELVNKKIYLKNKDDRNNNLKNVINVLQENFENADEFLSQELSKYFRTIISFQEKIFQSRSQNEAIKYVKCSKGVQLTPLDFKYRVLIDNLYYFKSEYVAFATIVRNLIDNSFCTAMIDVKNIIVGLKIITPCVRNEKPNEFDLFFEGFPIKNINVDKITSFRTATDYGRNHRIEIQTDKKIFGKIIDISLPLQQILEYFYNNYRLNYEIGINDKITSLKIDGLPLEKRMKKKITSLLSRHYPKDESSFSD